MPTIYIYQSLAYRLGLPAPYAVTFDHSSSSLPFTPCGWDFWCAAPFNPAAHPSIAASLDAGGFWESR